MSVDEGQENLFQILVRVQPGTRMRFWNSHGSWKKNMPTRRSFFAPCRSMATWDYRKTNWQMFMVLKDIPLRREIAATITSGDGNCLFNVVSLVLVGDETKMSLTLLVAVELILNCEF